LAWIVAALASAAIIAVVNIIDSHLLSMKMPSLASYLLPVGLTHLIVSSVLLIIFPLPDNPGVMPILVALGAGFLNGSASILMMNALRQGEVSRVVPVVSSSPIFIALLSVPLLGEALGFQDWLGILLTVAGAIVISIQRDGSGQKTRLQKSFFLLVLASLMYAVSSIGYKYALGTISFWNMYSVNGICVATVFLIYSARRSTFLQLKNLKQRVRALGLTVGNQCVVVVGMILSFVAVESGPVSLASAVMNIRPAFVFILAQVIGQFYPKILNERLNRSTILLKLIAVAMMTGGVVIITL
jgi:drug/metabolite transporter (DMT)-like permease